MILESSSIPTSLSTSSAPRAAILVATAYFSHALFVKDSELFHPCFIGRSLLTTSRPLRDTNEVFLVGGFALWCDIDSKQVVSSALTLVPKFTVLVNSPVKGLEPLATRKVRAVVGITVTDTDVAAYFSVSQVNFFICPFQLVQLLGHSPNLVRLSTTWIVSVVSSSLFIVALLTLGGAFGLTTTHFSFTSFQASMNN